MKTYWLIAIDSDTGKIATHMTRRFDGTKREAEAKRNERQAELGGGYLVVVETDKVARLYKSYRQFPDSDREAY